LRATRLDIVGAMSIAGLVNLSLLVAAAAAIRNVHIDGIGEAAHSLRAALGSTVAVCFAIALLVSGLASTSVGTYAGSAIMSGFLQRSVSLPVRRLVTVLPAVLLLCLGVDPARGLVLSQVVLCLGLPFALWPLVAFSSNHRLMGELVNRRLTTAVAAGSATLITVLGVVLVGLTLSA
jgi:manganese transport protein